MPQIIPSFKLSRKTGLLVRLRFSFTLPLHHLSHLSLSVAYDATKPSFTLIHLLLLPRTHCLEFLFVSPAHCVSLLFATNTIVVDLITINSLMIQTEDSYWFSRAQGQLCVASKMVRTTEKVKGDINRATHKMAPAPWIYINDAATDSRITQELIKLIPNTSLIPMRRSLDLNGPQFRDALSKAKGTVVVLRDTRSDDENDAKKDAICILKASAMKFGTNFVSVNVVYDPMQILKLSRMDSPHHLNVDNVVGTGQRVYDWLCKIGTCYALHSN